MESTEELKQDAAKLDRENLKRNIQNDTAFIHACERIETDGDVSPILALVPECIRPSSERVSYNYDGESKLHMQIVYEQYCKAYPEKNLTFEEFKSLNRENNGSTHRAN